ncbi:MAG: response regulator [Elainellaceae cyanobacterium]
MKKVMVVDDERDVQILFQQRFRKEIRNGQVEFSFAFSAEEALEQLNHNENEYLALIITDINMPGMNGLELLKIIKGTFTDLKVIMVTAYGDYQNYKRAMDYGADDYINKPIEFGSLKEKILGA